MQTLMANVRSERHTNALITNKYIQIDIERTDLVGFVCVCLQWALTKIYFFASRPMKSNKHFLHLLVNQKGTAEQRKQLIEKPSLAI